MEAFTNRFKDRVVIVTGGADGIGAAVGKRLIAEGAQLSVFDNHPENSSETVKHYQDAGVEIDSYLVDVSDETMVEDGFAAVKKKHGRIDAVVHAAGIVGPNATKAVDVKMDDFDQVCRVNLRGSYLVARAAIRQMEPANYGRILLFASIAGKEGNAGMSPYSITKAGVIGLVKALGKEYAESGITINAVAPAVIRTAMVESMEEWQVNYMTDKIPMKRCGTLGEIAALSCWIVSEEASFSTGAVYDLSGGRATY
ncbi:MAG: NAD(P)-dependent dehydrogenase (short-subunit alcohol dehydrogenase family) [Verrucomicrobiales bacterium]|jgi:NAD(P)-dependent dehydrogenase (short-subunit alcohol dehydrogenase family)